MPVAKMQPVAALVRAIRNIAAYNTGVALSYVAEPASFAGLTVAQRRTIHNLACSLFLVAPKDRETVTVDTLRGLAAEAEREGRNPKVVWVHQAYSPLTQPGQAKRPNLMVQFGAAVKAGMIAPATSYQDAVAAALTAKQIEQQPRKGGFILAVAADAAEQRANKPKRSSTKLVDPAALSEM